MRKGRITAATRIYRNDAELASLGWPSAPSEAAAGSKGYPIIDPHHHFSGIRRSGGAVYLLPELLDDLSGGHNNRVDRPFLECRSMYRKDGPAENRAGRRG